MPAFYYIPKASLAAVIICAVAPMVDYRLVAEMWRMTYHGVLLVELGSGLSFPATEHLSRVLHNQALL
ncbi:hypothetical protein CRUP_013766, partial [Coryphaenoides rupestris]